MRAGTFVAAVVLLAGIAPAAQVAVPGGHVHGPASGIPYGIPAFCTQPDVTSVASGAWSQATTWSTGRVPSAGDAVHIAADHAVTYDTVGDARVECIDIAGTLRFCTDVNTRLTVGTVTVLPEGTFEIGTPDRPVAPNVTAEFVIADVAIDTARDPEQLSGGLVGLGTITISGAPKASTFVRLAVEPLAGHTTLQLEQAVAGWRVGDRLVLPDTRQLRQSESGTSYQPQWEELTVAAVNGRTVTLSRPLAFDHRGARDAAGRLEFLPHVGNLTRNVVFRSENPAGTRGHTIFVQHPAVDIRYALFKEMGRTRMGVLDNAEFNADGSVRRVGTNQIGRYSIHFHHAFGPRRIAAGADEYQFTLIGNAVDDASKWGVAIHNSHYGLIRDNVVYNSRGAAIVAEDGSESFNVFEHNFAMRSEGSGEFAPRSGYGGATNDPGGEGAGFWMRGPNNIVRNNVAANVDVFGFGIAAGALGTVRVPSFKGADTTRSGEYGEVDSTAAAVLEFSGNEAYGATQTGIAIGWNATLTNSRVWHTTRHGLTVFPADRLEVDGFVGRGDVNVLQARAENPAGIWFNNYAAKTVAVRNADIQGLRVGVSSPFFTRTDLEPGRGDGVATIEDSFFRNYVGVSVATAYTRDGAAASLKTAIIRNSRFEPLEGVPASLYAPAAISMNYGMASGDRASRDPIVVYDFNGRPGDTFRVFYSHELPLAAAPACHAARSDIGGFVCAGN